MNKAALKKVVLISAVCTAGVMVYNFFSSRKDKENIQMQVREYAEAIASTLYDWEVTDFNSFAYFLNEFYGIKAERFDRDIIAYSSDKYKVTLTSDDIFAISNFDYCYDLNELEKFFSCNRALCQETEFNYVEDSVS